MARVTGILSDYGLGHLAGLHPTLHFQPSGPATSDTDILAPDDVVIVPIGATGYFEANLQPTVGLRPAVYYTVTIRWGSGRNVPLPWKLAVPAGGGVLTELLQVPPNLSQAWIGTTPPPNPVPGLWWFNPVTGDLNVWSA